jgi:hypothetical protein
MGQHIHTIALNKASSSSYAIAICHSARLSIAETPNAQLSVQAADTISKAMITS